MRQFVYLLLIAFCLLLPLTVHADDLPPSAFVDRLVGYPQEHNLSCESRSATDVAAFWNVSFAEDDFFYRLPKSDNPNRGFLGDVDLPAGSMPPVGYGVYGGPIAANLRSFGLAAQAHQNWDLDSLKAELAAGRPVIIWSTYDMKLPGGQTWVSSDGVASIVIQWQHTFVAVGYDETGVYLVDAYDAETKHFSYEAFVPAWEQLGRIAVTVARLAPLPSGRVWNSIEVDSGATGTVARSFIVDGRWMVGPE
ncbi:MAG: hypothetical protein GY832_08625 [Chloroflexi bacterium]|nr:hypothetical protein [Chloroflexota bacterium]